MMSYFYSFGNLISFWHFDNKQAKRAADPLKSFEDKVIFKTVCYLYLFLLIGSSNLGHDFQEIEQSLHTKAIFIKITF